MSKPLIRFAQRGDNPKLVHAELPFIGAKLDVICNDARVVFARVQRSYTAPNGVKFVWWDIAPEGSAT